VRKAKNYEFFAVCVNSTYVSLAKKLLEGTGVKIASVVGFPLGASSTFAKVQETEKAIRDGADEVDMVIKVGYLKQRSIGKLK